MRRACGRGIVGSGGRAGEPAWTGGGWGGEVGGGRRRGGGPAIPKGGCTRFWAAAGRRRQGPARSTRRPTTWHEPGGKRGARVRPRRGRPDPVQSDRVRRRDAGGPAQHDPAR